MINDFTPDSEIQLNLFENSTPKHSPLMQVVERINHCLVKKKSNWLRKIRSVFGK